MTDTIYHLIEREDGSLSFRRDDWFPLSETDMNNVITAVRNSRREDKNNELSIVASEMSKQAKWFFPVRKSDVTGHSRGVYFITDEAYASQVKIGCTSKTFLPRINEVKINCGCVDPQILAIAEIWEHQKFEKALHGMFDDYRIRRTEWFELDEVVNFLDEVKAYIKSREGIVK
jgi:hypothetical protein